ncbi:MAG: hypothetical protein IPM98_22525 [Lewinellaceae bacterium]|nr:hypothetical protein [Lewinellaceae bacterium]
MTPLLHKKYGSRFGCVALIWVAILLFPGLGAAQCPADGITWATRNAAQANQWNRVTYGNGLFVAVASDGTNRVMTSPDGITWTARNAAAANAWWSVTYGNGLFVAVAQDGANRVMTSPDGITWTARNAAAASNWISVTYANGLFVAVAWTGTNRVMTSPDGITWTARNAAAANQWVSVTYGNGLFVATAQAGTNRVITSPDGITWTARSAPGATNSWECVTYGNGLFVAVSWNGTPNRVITSPDGINWTARTPEFNTWYAVVYANGLFVATSGANRVMTSPDGINWTAYPAPQASEWYSVTYGNGTFVAVSQNGANRVMTNPSFVTPAVSIVANPGNTIAAGTSVTFTATPTNGGATPAFQWKKNNVNVGTNSPTYTDATLVNGDVITVVMTSSAPCALPATATSNQITMTVTGCTLPAFTACPPAPVTQCDAVVTYTVAASGIPTPTLTYAFTGATTGSGGGTGSGATFNQGNTTVTVTATNSCGGPTCVFTVSVAATDNDGTADCNDGCPNDPNKTAPVIAVVAIQTPAHLQLPARLLFPSFQPIQAAKAPFRIIRRWHLSPAPVVRPARWYKHRHRAPSSTPAQ